MIIMMLLGDNIYNKKSLMSKAKLVSEAIRDVLKPITQENILEVLEQKKEELKGLDGREVIRKLTSETGTLLVDWQISNLIYLLIEDAHGECEDYVLSKLVEYFYDVME